MKAVLYALRKGDCREARISVAWEVDCGYWEGSGAEIVRVKEELPLGMAVDLSEKLNEMWAREGSGGRIGSLSDAPIGESVRQGGVRERERMGPGSHASGEMIWLEELKRALLSCVDMEGVSAGEERDGAEKIEIEKAIGQGRKSDSEGKMGVLAKAIRMAAPALAGRSLLREEAEQLLPRLLPAGLKEAPLAALQLASLMGIVRLAAAVSPEPARPPLRGLRAWAERLRSARLPGLGAPASRRRPELRCRRCGSGSEALRRTPCAACGRQACAYCAACLTMGRSRECGLLVIGALAQRPEAGAVSAANFAGAPEAVCVPGKRKSYPIGREHLSKRWGLSAAQAAAANKALTFLQERITQKPSTLNPSRLGTPVSNDRAFLLWAVTGAGKTEMIFPLLDFVVSQGGRALVATPRRDVVLELAPRLAKAFPDVPPIVLYGGSEMRWETGALTLATTQQLFRFQEAFDLVLIDELDAFPFHNDPMLHYAAEKCRRPFGVTVYLSATPPAPMQRAVARGKLSCARVPVRFHGNPLPVPGRIAISRLSELLKKQRLPSKLFKPLQRSVHRGAQIFMFVPYIKQVEPFVSLLKHHADRLGLSAETIAGTSSKDEERTNKVADFRSGALRLLVTTTILERGVTIPRSDVYVIDSHHAMFDGASLVQMAGRAGRSAADPAGVVRFAAPSWTNAQQEAVRQIRAMNALAAREGFLNS
ncbi:helicase-related protein [Cohnella soli]|uniref:Helicase-related protein n=1 Tax=Cohnella soli TaxID=425005 RepID=A0ABW0HL48_9BACL